MDIEVLVPLLTIIALLVVPFVVFLRRANELFVLRVVAGKVQVVRGRPPPALLRDVGDVVRDLPDATITASLENGLPMVRATGVPAPQLQRVRNVVGRFRKAQLGARR